MKRSMAHLAALAVMAGAAVPMPAQGRHFLLAEGDKAEPGLVRFLTQKIELAEGASQTWVTITRTGDFCDPRYGDFKITPTHLDQMVANFNTRVLGQDVFLDVAHRPNDGAAGKFLKLAVENGRLRGLVEWTPFGVDAVKGRGFAYLSAEYHENWKDNEKQMAHGCVLLGAGLTTRPVIKHLDPVQLAVDDDDHEGVRLCISPSLLRELTNQHSTEQSMNYLEQLKAKLLALGLTDDVVTKLLAQAKVQLEAAGKDDDKCKAIVLAWEDTGKAVHAEIKKLSAGGGSEPRNVTITLANPGAAPDVGKAVADALDARERKLAEDKGTVEKKLKLLSDTIAEDKTLTPEGVVKLAADVAPLISAATTDDNVKALAALQLKNWNALSAAQKLVSLGFRTPSGNVQISVDSGNGIKALQVEIDKRLGLTETKDARRFERTGGELLKANQAFADKVLAEFDAATRSAGSCCPWKRGTYDDGPDPFRRRRGSDRQGARRDAGEALLPGPGQGRVGLGVPRPGDGPDRIRRVRRAERTEMIGSLRRGLPRILLLAAISAVLFALSFAPELWGARGGAWPAIVPVADALARVFLGLALGDLALRILQPKVDPQENAIAALDMHAPAPAIVYLARMLIAAVILVLTVTAARAQAQYHGAWASPSSTAHPDLALGSSTSAAPAAPCCAGNTATSQRRTAASPGSSWTRSAAMAPLASGGTLSASSTTTQPRWPSKPSLSDGATLSRLDSTPSLAAGATAAALGPTRSALSFVQWLLSALIALVTGKRSLASSKPSSKPRRDSGSSESANAWPIGWRFVRRCRLAMAVAPSMRFVTAVLSPPTFRRESALKRSVRAKAMSGLLCMVVPAAFAASSSDLPPRARQYLPTLREQIQRFWPDVPLASTLGGQTEKETCPSLKHRMCWSPRAELRTSREQGVGLGQLTRAFRSDGSTRFDALAEIRAAHPRELAGLSWDNRYDAVLQLRALVLKDRQDYRLVRGAATQLDRLAMMLAAYNGGHGGLASDRRVCAATPGCDTGRWFGHVEHTSTKAKAAVKGYGQSFFSINRGYVREILHVRRFRYLGLET